MPSSPGISFSAMEISLLPKSASENIGDFVILFGF